MATIACRRRQEELFTLPPRIADPIRDHISSAIDQIYKKCLLHSGLWVQRLPECQIEMHFERLSPVCKVTSRIVKIISIQLIQFKKCKEKAQQKWTFRFDDEGRQSSESYVVDSDKNLRQLAPIHYLNGNEYEEHLIAPDDEIQPSSFWTSWKLDTEAISALFYRRRLYPTFQKYLEPLGTYFQRPFTVLELGGGDGELGCSLLSTNHRLVTDYHLVDNNSVIIEKTKKLRDAQLFKKKLHVHCQNITQGNFAQITRSPADVIILCGVAAHGVLKKEQSASLILACKEALRVGGIMLVASLSPHHLSAGDYENEGFKVWNRSFYFESDLVIGRIYYRTFYVLEKLPPSLPSPLPSRGRFFESHKFCVGAGFPPL